MNIIRLVGLLAIIPVALLLTVSFFVLFALGKIQEKRLKTFGYVIVALLWVGALLVTSLGAYTVYTGRHPMMEIMKGMRMQSMMGSQMPMTMQQREMMMRNKMLSPAP